MAAITNAERARRDRLYREGEKDCSACGRQKPLADFGSRSDCWRGLHPECRKCKNARTHAYQVRNPDKANAKVRRWNAENRDLARAAAKRWRDANPEKERARKLRWAARKRVAA
jgi:hypothetical protein